jgi:hypothetical protein
LETLPEIDVTVVLRTCDDEERIASLVQRVTAACQGLSCELLVADEGSGDNTVAVAILLRQAHPGLEVLHAAPGRGLAAGAERARGRVLVLADARHAGVISGLSEMVARIVGGGADVVAVDGSFLAARRTRAWRAFSALVERRRDPAAHQARFLRRASGLRLRVERQPGARRSRLDELRRVLFAPLAVRL